MPTIPQLPHSATVTAADTIPISQNGTAKSTTLGTLLAQTQPAIIIPSGALLGRSSLGPGGPEAVQIGTGLTFNHNTLSATATGNLDLTLQTGLNSGDQVMIVNGGVASLLAVEQIRAIFHPGSHIAIDGSGIISAGWPTVSSDPGTGLAEIGALPLVTGGGGTNILPISQNGTTYGITVEHLLNGLTIDLAQSAGAANDSDAFWVAQGGNSMTRQTLAALWTWVATKLTSYKKPIVEIDRDSTLDSTTHNGRILVCKAAVLLSALPINMGAGFNCEVINLSPGTVSLDGAFISSSGALAIPSQKMARLRCATVNGALTLYADISGNGGGGAVLPDAVDHIVATPASTTVALTWNAPLTGGAVTGYTIRYRATGTTVWSLAGSVGSVQAFTVTGLSSATNYDVSVSASNSAGSGPLATTAATTTSSAPTVPG
jgi:hypothetical protein